MNALHTKTSSKEPGIFLKKQLKVTSQKVTSQNVSSEAQIKNFLISQKNYVPFSRYSSIVFLNIPWFTKSMTSQWVHEISTWDKYEYIFWTTMHEVTKLDQLIDISTGNNF